MPVKPKLFTEQLISGKGLPEIEQTLSAQATARNNEINKPKLVKQTHVTESDSVFLVKPIGSDTQRQSTIDVHPAKLTPGGFSVKQPDSPSHAEIDQSPGKKSSPSSITRNKSSAEAKTKQKKKSQEGGNSFTKFFRDRKLSSEMGNRNGKSPKGASDKKVGKATFYRPSQSEDISFEDTFEINRQSLKKFASEDLASERDVISKQMKVGKATFYKADSLEDLIDEQQRDSPISPIASKENRGVENKNGLDSHGLNQVPIIKPEKDKKKITVNKTEGSTSQSKNTVALYENVTENNVPITDELYENVEVITEQDGIKSLKSVAETDENYEDMSQKGGQEYTDMEAADSGIVGSRISKDSSTVSDDVYDNAEFKPEMMDNDLYESREAKYEVIEFHRTRNIKGMSRRHKLRKTKRQKPTLLEDDIYQPVNFGIEGMTSNYFLFNLFSSIGKKKIKHKMIKVMHVN